jgi:hypothetical protein
MATTMKRLLSGFTACTLLCASGLGWSQTAKVSLTAQERLDAIRHSLVETALQGATQVRTTQWLDAQGQLRDASSFRSGMEVRGVQVKSYSRDSAGNVQAQLSSPNANKDLSRSLSNSAEDSCKPQALRHVLGLTTVFEASTSATIQKQVRQHLAAPWLSASDSAWRMEELPVMPPVLSTGKLASSYEQALTRSTPPQLPWNAVLRVSAQTQELPAWEKIVGRSPHHTLITLELLVHSANGQNKQFQATKSLQLPLKNTDWASSSLDEAGVALLQQVGRLWGDRLGQWMGCDPLQPMVTQKRANQVQINAGGLAGVRPGDEWLLADPQAFPSHVVGPSSAALLLAKVVEVTPHHAQLAVLAGPADAVQTHWRAWPAESLNR